MNRLLTTLRIENLLQVQKGHLFERTYTRISTVIFVQDQI